VKGEKPSTPFRGQVAEEEEEEDEDQEGAAEEQKVIDMIPRNDIG